MQSVALTGESTGNDGAARCECRNPLHIRAQNDLGSPRKLRLSKEPG